MNSIDKAIKGFKTESDKLGRYSFVMGGIRTLCNSVEVVSDDLEIYLSDIEDDAERNHLKEQIQEQIAKLKNLLVLFEGESA